MLATGLMNSNDEPNAVMEEMLALRYTGAQLRFAFVLLLEQEPAPITLFKRYERALMQDFLHSGKAVGTARALLRQHLQRAWLELGNAAEDWKLNDATNVASPDGDHTPHAAQPGFINRDLSPLIAADPDQREASSAVLNAWRRGTEAF